MWFNNLRKKGSDPVIKVPFLSDEKRTKPPPITIGGVGNASTAVLNIHDGTWLYMLWYCERTIQDLREKNDNPNLTEIKSAVIRGRIQALKDILELPNENKKLSKNNVDWGHEEIY